MKVEALYRFDDLKAKVTREKGDIFEVSEERYNELVENELGIVFVAQIPFTEEEPKQEEPQEEEPKKKTGRKKAE